MQMINKFIRAISAGVMIGIAGAIYLAVGPPLGAILFAIGLIIICNRKYNLYTGKIGYIQKKSPYSSMSLRLVNSLYYFCFYFKNLQIVIIFLLFLYSLEIKQREQQL